MLSFGWSSRLYLSAVLCTALISSPAQSQPTCLPTTPVDCSTGKYITWLPPVGWAKEVHAKACMKHDYCYRFGADTYGYTRDHCDTKFLDDMQSHCRDINFWDVITLGGSIAVCEATAQLFYAAVSGLGEGSFQNRGTGKVCEYDGAQLSRGWQRKFSEESSGLGLCPQNQAVTGIWCSGSRCDNINLHCTKLPPEVRIRSQRWLPNAISEENGRNTIETDRGQLFAVATGLQCLGGWCDNIKTQVYPNEQLRAFAGASHWTEYAKNNGYAKCGDGEFVTGLRCKGPYCSEVSLKCTAMRMDDYARQVAPTVGTIEIALSGKGKVTVTGPQFSETFDRAWQIQGLLPGAYTIRTQAFTVGRHDKPICTRYIPQGNANQQVQVQGGRSLRVNVAYRHEDCRS